MVQHTVSDTANSEYTIGNTVIDTFNLAHFHQSKIGN